MWQASLAVLLVLADVASADEKPDPGAATQGYDDGYCDYVEGVASAQSAIQLAPSLFGQFGYINQSVISPTIDPPSSLRFIGGVRYNLTNVYSGFQNRARAKADCERHNALNTVRGGTSYRALEARVKVLEAALPEADKIFKQVDDDFKARRISAPEFTATRLRIDELRQLAVETRRQMSALPPSSDNLGGALKAFQRADAEVESHEGKLRFANAFDLSIRFGIDSLGGSANDTSSPFFAIASLDVNLGALFVGSANARAATGRQRQVRSGRDPLSVDATADRLRVIAEAEEKRYAETEALEEDLAKQLEVLARIGGDESRRFKLTIWFDWVKVKAEKQYLSTHIAAIKEVIGE